MTLQKAIELLQRGILERPNPHYQDLTDAMKLGIEALKFRRRWEEQEGEDDYPLLPGETTKD